MRRVGVRVAPDAISVVAVGSDGGSVESAFAVAGSVPDAIATALRGLPAEFRQERAVLVFDVGAALAPCDPRALVVIRIAPRAPVDEVHDRRLALSREAAVVHIAGGHSTLGNELAPLDTAGLHAVAATLPRGAVVVVTAVGSMVDDQHERAAADIVRRAADPASIVLSSSFFANSVRERERTAVLNGRLLASAEALAEEISDAASLVAPRARLFCSVNEGGCAPLSRLPVMPVHSLASHRANELIGAVSVAGVRDGRIVVAREDGAVLGELIDGLPTVVGKTEVRGASIASICANVAPLSDALLGGREGAPPAVSSGDAARTLAYFGLAAAAGTDLDLVSLGAALSPLSYWRQRLVRVRSSDEIARALSEARALATARLVSFGAALPDVTVTESQVVGSTYGDPQVVRVRVRAIAAMSESVLVGAGDGGATSRPVGSAAPGAAEREVPWS